MPTLAELREKLKAAREAAAAARAKAVADGATDADRTAYKDALTATEKALDMVKDAERMEALDAATTRLATAAAGGTDVLERSAAADGRFAYARPAEKMSILDEATLMAAASAKSRAFLQAGIAKSPIEILGDEGYERFVKELKDRASANAARRREKTNTTLTSADGGILLPTPNANTIIELLRGENTFLAANPRRVPLIGGQFNQPRGATSSTAGYVGEGMKKPVGSPTFNGISMRAKKIAGIVMVTMEALKWSLADLQAYIRDDLRLTLANNMDLACYFGAGTNYTPLGILNRPNVNAFDASATGAGALFANPKAPTVAELDRVATRMILAITDANIPATSRFAWTMNYHLMRYLADARGANGQYIYPELNTDTPTWKRFRVFVTTQFPSNGGATTDESTLALVDWSNVLYGDEEDITVRTSMEATIDPGTGTLVHLFQQNMMAVLMEAQHDIALNYDQAVSVLRHARWGSLSAS
ncbi:phage major capsid protein [Methylobacterium fujisawaense]|uniref:phage major capsid protein n=1 Tax=Methylobacterium fujisawaense TaxID=107400 RepID=UPI00313D0905